MNIKNALLAGIITSSTFTMNVIAADVEAGVVKNVPQSSYLQSDSFRISPSDLSEKANSSSTSNDIKLKAATGISYFEIGYVRSSKYDLEAISQSQSSTAADHGGAILYIYVWQFGYGNANEATMNGISKGPSLSQYRCGNDLHLCEAGETVTGWLYVYDFSGQESGKFTVSADSTASPFGYWSDSIYIK